MTAVPLRFVKNEWRLTMMTSFVGVDLHRNNFTYCIRENGEEKKIGKCEISELKGFASLPETLPRLISAPPPEENAAPLPPHSPRFPRKPHAGNCAENSFSEETGNPFLLNNELIGSMMQYHVIFC